MKAIRQVLKLGGRKWNNIGNNNTKVLFNNLVAQKQFLFKSTKSLHTLPELPYDSDLGLEPALSTKSLRLIYNDFQKHWVDSLNKMVIGSKYEKEDLEKLIMKSSQVLEDRVVYNTSSQIWNTTFCLKSLSKEPVEMNNSIKKLITDSFGSYEKMVELFDTKANSLFGGGFIWLVYEDGIAKIMITPNAESPLYPFRPSISEEGKESKVLDLKAERNCLLGINLWGYGYILDYGMNKSDYIKKCLNQVDWNNVYIRYRDPSSRFTRKVIS